MLTVYILILLLAGSPSAWLLRRFYQETEKPARAEVLGIVLCTLAAMAYLGYLMHKNYFF